MKCLYQTVQEAKELKERFPVIILILCLLLSWVFVCLFVWSHSVALASLELTEIRLFLECCRVRKACAPHPANFSLGKKKKSPETNGKGSWRQPWAPVYPNCLHFKNVTFFSVTVLRHWPPSQDTICVFSSLFSDIAQTQDLSRSVLFALIGLKTLPHTFGEKDFGR